MNKWKLAGVTLITLSALLIVAGCVTPQMEDVNRRVLGYAIGIDAGEFPGTVSLSLQYFAPIHGASQERTGGRQPIILTVEAGSMGAGWAQMKSELPGELFKGTVELIVVGKAIVDQGVYQVMDDLGRHPAIPLNAQVVMTSSIARELLAHEVKGRDAPSNFIIDMFMGLGKRRLDLWRFYDGALSPWRTTFVPIIDVQEKGMKLSGYGLFQGDRLARTLTLPVAGMLLASRRPQTTDVELEPLQAEGGPLTVRLTRIRIKSSLAPGASVAQVAISGTAVLVEGPNVIIAGEMEQQLQEHAARSIEQRVRSALESLYADGIDILNLSELARRQMSDGKLPSTWPEQVKKISLQVQSTIKITHGARGR